LNNHEHSHFFASSHHYLSGDFKNLLTLNDRFAGASRSAPQSPQKKDIAHAYT
jgi:hypothetical protein